jgi:hypothetical protein
VEVAQLRDGNVSDAFVVRPGGRDQPFYGLFGSDRGECVGCCPLYQRLAVLKPLHDRVDRPLVTDLTAGSNGPSADPWVQIVERFDQVWDRVLIADLP